jgi:hypothetical protein
MMPRRLQSTPCAKRSGRGGRPPAGLNGEPTSKYPQLATRVPPATLESLRVLATREQRSIWRILVDAVEIYARRETKPSQLS